MNTKSITRGSRPRRLATLIFALLSAAPLLFGQAFTQLSGFVTDPAGAVVPGTRVTLESSDKGIRRETASDGTGLYRFLQIQPGTYQITAHSSGLKDVIVPDVQLLVNTPATINISFEEIGALTESITVSDAATQVNTTDASLGNAIGNKAITQLPLYARNVAGLLAFQPGVVAPSLGGEISGSVNGGKNDQANITLDGMDVNEQSERSAFTTVLRSTLDSVQEFRTTTSNAAADQGRSSGAQIALVTKSGTNEFHGSLYDYHRNTVFSANDWFSNRAGVPRPQLLIDVFGGALGGPLKKNRLFFFSNYEGRRDRSATTESRTVPSMDLRQGIVKYRTTSGTISQLTPLDLKTRVDPLGIGPSQDVLRVFQSYPEPNNLTGGDQLNTFAYSWTQARHSKQDTYIARLDYTVDAASEHSLFLRGNLQDDATPGAPPFPGVEAASSTSKPKGIAAGHTWLVSPTMVSTFRYGWTRAEDATVGNLEGGGYTAFDGIGLPQGTTVSSSNLNPVHQISEDIAWIRGPHDLRFGMVGRWIKVGNFRPVPVNSAQIRVSRLNGAANALMSPIADLAPGDVNSTGLPITVSNGRSWPVNWWVAGYATTIGEPAMQISKNQLVPGATTAGPNIFADPAAAAASFTKTEPGETGARNALRMPSGTISLDTGLSKRFTMPYNENHSLQFRWESFNVANFVRFYQPSPNIDNQFTFGNITATWTDPRQMQFALRYEF